MEESFPASGSETYERILNLWADGKTSPEIREELGVTRRQVQITVEKGRRRQDERAYRRQESVSDLKYNTLAAVDAAKAKAKDADGKPPSPISLAPISTEIARLSLRPLIESIRDRQDYPSRCMTPYLMGDPPPHRSALGRECRPDEYASKGEGRYRDPMLGCCVGSGVGLRHMG